MGFLPIGAITLLALPALLVAKAPRRWLWAVMALWTVSPAIVFLALALIGKAIGTPAELQPGSFGDALLLAGSFLLIPWTRICGAGSASDLPSGRGFANRHRSPRRPRAM